MEFVKTLAFSWVITHSALSIRLNKSPRFFVGDVATNSTKSFASKPAPSSETWEIEAGTRICFGKTFKMFCVTKDLLAQDRVWSSSIETSRTAMAMLQSSTYIRVYDEKRVVEDAGGYENRDQKFLDANPAPTRGNPEGLFLDPWFEG